MQKHNVKEDKLFHAVVYKRSKNHKFTRIIMKLKDSFNLVSDTIIRHQTPNQIFLLCEVHR